AGDMEGYVIAFDAATGKLVWKTATGGAVRAAPMAYAVDNRQYVAVAAGGSLFAFGLPEPSRGANEKAVGSSSRGVMSIRGAGRAMCSPEESVVVLDLIGVGHGEGRDGVIELRRLADVAGQLRRVSRSGMAFGEGLPAQRRVFQQPAPREFRRIQSGFVIGE